MCIWTVFVICLHLQHQVSPFNTRAKSQMFRENCFWQNFQIKDRLVIVYRQIQ